MSIGRFCTRQVSLAEPQESVADAARRMRDHDVGTLVVLDAERRPVGIVTDRDLVVRALAAEAEDLRVRDVMSAPADAMPEDLPVEDALAWMRSKRHRRLLVVDREGHLVGILALDDVLGLLASELYRIGDLVSSAGDAPSAYPC